MEPNRRIQWISSTDPKNELVLADLQTRMQRFYAESPNYYGDIDFTRNAWLEDASYRDIVSRLAGAQRIVEAGCGSANILRHHPEFVSHYSGCDFSDALLRRNQETFPDATFVGITDPRKLPFESESADAVFSVYVIEHTIYPAEFLTECWRVLRPGGVFILRCPDFLGASRMTSQRAGFSFGTGREKLAQGNIVDAIITGWDRKVAIPRRCAQLRRAGGGFHVNLAPVCFEDPFLPDHDAIYVTYAQEMVEYLRGRIAFLADWAEVNSRWPIYLVGRKI